jgi:hypothetical protein
MTTTAIRECLASESPKTGKVMTGEELKERARQMGCHSPDACCPAFFVKEDGRFLVIGNKVSAAQRDAIGQFGNKIYDNEEVIEISAELFRTAASQLK